MKNLLFIIAICLLTGTVSTAFFWYGTLPGPDACSPEKRHLAGAGRPSLVLQSPRSSSSPLAPPSPADASSAALSSEPSLAPHAPAVSDHVIEPTAATGRYGDSSVAIERGSVTKASPSPSNSAPAGTAAPGSAVAAGRLVGPRSATVPLAFKNIDLFINTAEGLHYAPVDFTPSSNSQSKSAAPPKPGDPGTLVVNEAAAADLNAMREDFTNAVGGLGQNGADPQYLRRWQTEQSISDQRFRSRFGTQAFLSYQTAAAHKAEAERQSAAKK